MTGKTKPAALDGATAGSGRSKGKKHSSGLRRPRKAPAYLVYASDDLANQAYYALELNERGLLDSMRRGCWVAADGTVPADPAELAIVVRRPESEVRAALSPRLLALFQETRDGALFDPELREQREATERVRNAQSEGARLANLHRAQRHRDAESAADTGAVTGSVSAPVWKRKEENRKEEAFDSDLSSPEVVPEGAPAAVDVPLEVYLADAPARPRVIEGPWPVLDLEASDDEGLWDEARRALP